MSLGTVKPVVGRSFKMRGGQTARIDRYELKPGGSFPFIGMDESGDDGMTWRPDGTWFWRPGVASAYDLVEMLPRYPRWAKLAALVAVMAAGLFLLAGCGKFERAAAGFTGGGVETCHDGVSYVQFTSGASVKYSRQTLLPEGC